MSKLSRDYSNDNGSDDAEAELYRSQGRMQALSSTAASNASDKSAKAAREEMRAEVDKHIDCHRRYKQAVSHSQSSLSLPDPKRARREHTSFIVASSQGQVSRQGSQAPTSERETHTVSLNINPHLLPDAEAQHPGVNVTDRVLNVGIEGSGCLVQAATTSVEVQTDVSTIRIKDPDTASLTICMHCGTVNGKSREETFEDLIAALRIIADAELASQKTDFESQLAAHVAQHEAKTASLLVKGLEEERQRQAAQQEGLRKAHSDLHRILDKVNMINYGEKRALENRSAAEERRNEELQSSLAVRTTDLSGNRFTGASS